MVSQEFLNHLKDQLSLSQYVSQHVKLQRVGTLFTGLCPFHNEKTPSFTIYDEQETYHCFGCGAHGDIITFLRKKDGLSFCEAIRYLASKIGLRLPQEWMNEEEENEQRILRSVCEETALWYHKHLWTPVGQPTRNYLAGRGFSPDILAQFRVGYSPPGENLSNYLKHKGFENHHLVRAGVIARSPIGFLYDRFSSRITFPIIDPSGRVIAFGGRSLDGKGPKYINTSETVIFHKSKTLYAYSFACKRPQETPVIVVEGYTDAMSLHQAGIEGAVATLGTSITIDQIDLLWKTHNCPMLCFDGDEAGQAAAIQVALRVLPALSLGKSLSFITIPNGEDPDSLIRTKGKSFFEELVVRPAPLVDILFGGLIQREHGKIRTPEERAEVLNKLCLVANKIRDPSIRRQYYDEIHYRVKLATLRFRSKDKALSLSGKSQEMNLTRFDVVMVQQKILMATVLLFPEIIKEILEPLGQLTFDTNALACLQSDVLSLVSEPNKLDRASVRDFLYSRGLKDLYQEVICPSVLVHAPFLTKNIQPVSMVIHEWINTYTSLMNRKLRKSTQEKMKDYLSQDLTADRWEEVKQVYTGLAQKLGVDGHDQTC